MEETLGLIDGIEVVEAEVVFEAEVVLLFEKIKGAKLDIVVAAVDGVIGVVDVVVVVVEVESVGEVRLEAGLIELELTDELGLAEVFKLDILLFFGVSIRALELDLAGGEDTVSRVLSFVLLLVCIRQSCRQM